MAPLYIWLLSVIFMVLFLFFSRITERKFSQKLLVWVFRSASQLYRRQVIFDRRLASLSFSAPLSNRLVVLSTSRSFCRWKFLEFVSLLLIKGYWLPFLEFWREESFGSLRYNSITGVDSSETKNMINRSEILQVAATRGVYWQLYVIVEAENRTVHLVAERIWSHKRQSERESLKATLLNFYQNYAFFLHFQCWYPY